MSKTLREDLATSWRAWAAAAGVPARGLQRRLALVAYLSGVSHGVALTRAGVGAARLPAPRAGLLEMEGNVRRVTAELVAALATLEADPDLDDLGTQRHLDLGHGLAVDLPPYVPAKRPESEP